jgi:hypothetical protein
VADPGNRRDPKRRARVPVRHGVVSIREDDHRLMVGRRRVDLSPTGAALSFRSQSWRASRSPGGDASRCGPAHMRHPSQSALGGSAD